MNKQNGKFFYLIALFIVFAVGSLNIISCKNILDELIPNNEQKIIDFNLKNIDRRICSTKCEVKGQSITVTVPAGTDVINLFPEAVISSQAILFPITLRYLQEAFPATDILKLTSYANNVENIGALDKWFFSLYSDNPGFNIPPLVFPVNFLSPVSFAVIGGQGGFEMYTVKVMYDDGTDPATGILPPGIVAEKNILTFNVPELQIGTSVIAEDKIDFKVKAEAEVRSLLPVITSSEGTVVLPLTQEYLKKFCEENGLDYLNVLSGLISAPDKRGYLRGMVASLDISKIRVSIDKPIDFTDSVYFAVLGKDKDVKLYTATCEKDLGEAYLENFAITKFQNPSIVTDSKIEIDKGAKTIKATLFYPVEYVQGAADVFSLFCDAVFIGDSAEIEYKGVKYSLPETRIPFIPENPSGQYDLGSVTAVLYINNKGAKTSYALTLNFKEDPDTMRSITDFRFEKFKNNGIKNTAMAAISNNGHEGTISLTVLYDTPEKPETLVPSFISAGKVTVNGAVQHSAVDAQDFRTVKVYLCTSKNGQYTRRYMVKVKFIKVETLNPALKSFKFPYNLNGSLSGDAVGKIDEITNSVDVNVQYSSPEIPEVLIPEFSATGDVTVDGLIQSSGFSSQNFKYTVYYKVSDPSDPASSKTYSVHVTFTFPKDSGCELLSFAFLTANNPSLTGDIEVPVSNYSNILYAVLPKDADITNLIPSFTAKGNVSLDGAEQTSGVSAVDFSAPAEYTVISENGTHTKRYIVKLQKAGDIIYVNTSASGRNNGLTWEDAFIRLDTALEKAESLAQDTIPEIWITKDSILTGEFKINRQLVLRGGFGGTEVSQDQRNKENRTLCRHAQFYSRERVSGKIFFDSFEVLGEHKTISFANFYWGNSASQENFLEFKNCNFGEKGSVKLERVYGSVNLKITDSKFASGSRLSTRRSEYMEYGDSFRGTIELSGCELQGEIYLSTKSECSIENCKFTVGTNIYAGTSSIKQVETEKSFSIKIAENGTAKLTDIRFDGASLGVSTSEGSTAELADIRAYNSKIDITAAEESTVKIENCNIKELKFYSGVWNVKKLNAVEIKNSFIGELSPYSEYIITARLHCSGKYAGLGSTGNNLTLPACQTEITNASFSGTVNTLCAKNIFGSVFNGINLSTNINNVKADTLKCGIIREKREYPLKSNLFESYENMDSNSYYKFFEVHEEADAGGIQTITGSTFRQCYVFSGDEINFSDNKITGNKEHRQTVNGELYIPLRTEYGTVNRFDEVFLINAATRNSRISVSKINASYGWFRAETNTLKVGGADGTKGVSGFSRAEFYGITSVDVRKSDFKDILPVYFLRDYTYNNLNYTARESFIAAGSDVTVTANDFKYGCPVLIGAVNNFNISNNNFSGGRYPKNEVEQSGKDMKQYFELTLLCCRSINLSDTAFASLLVVDNHKLLNDILNLSGENSGEVKIKNCHFTNGLSLVNRKSVIDGCSFGNGKPLTNCLMYVRTLSLYGKSNAVIQNLDVQYEDVFCGNFLKNNIFYREGFFFIGDGIHSGFTAGSLVIRDCTFRNFEHCALIMRGETEVEFTRNSFIYEKREDKTKFFLYENIIEFYNKKLKFTQCNFTDDGKVSVASNESDPWLSFLNIDTKITEIEDNKFLLTTSTSLHSIVNAYPIYYFRLFLRKENSSALIKKCEFKCAPWEIYLIPYNNVKIKGATVESCTFKEGSLLNIRNYDINKIEDPALAKVKNCNMGYKSFIKIYNHAGADTANSVIYAPFKVEIENCIFNPGESGSKPYYFMSIVRSGYENGQNIRRGPTMLMCKYTNAAEAAQYTSLLQNKIYLETPECQAAFMNLPDNVSPASSAADAYKIKGTVAPLSP